jgi:hypothetical protein
MDRVHTKHLRCLKRRYQFLTDRVKVAEKHLSYDEHERTALAWAIGLIESLTDDQMSRLASLNASSVIECDTMKPEATHVT